MYLFFIDVQSGRERKNEVWTILANGRRIGGAI
jgi:hypothetical protein